MEKLWPRDNGGYDNDDNGAGDRANIARFSFFSVSDDKHGECARRRCQSFCIPRWRWQSDDVVGGLPSTMRRIRVSHKSAVEVTRVLPTSETTNGRWKFSRSVPVFLTRRTFLADSSYWFKKNGENRWSAADIYVREIEKVKHNIQEQRLLHAQ